MVAQFPEGTTSISKVLTPEIKVDVKTFVEGVVSVSDPQNPREYRLCAVSILTTNIKKDLAVATFNRIFVYAQSLANNDINPIPNININSVEPNGNMLQAKPETGLILSIDSTESIALCNLTLNVANLRLDYMDEYFNSTLTYLTNAIANDLNP